MLRRDFIRLSLACAIALAGCSSKRQIEVMYAGSLVREMEELIIPEFERRYGYEVSSEARGSVAIVEMVKDGLRRPDVVISADYTLLNELAPKFLDRYYIFASNSLVVAGKNGVPENWIDAILSGEVSAGMSDPAVDPLGYRTLLMFRLAEKYYGESFYDELVSKVKVFALETDLSANLFAGTVDIGFLYRNMAVNHGLNFLELPEEIDLSNPDFENLYSTVSVRVGERVYRGKAIAYGIAGLKGMRGKEFVDFVLSDGLPLLRKSGLKTFVREVRA
ncbi:extracellular solute-binding protein [Geoglobus ahangari]